MSGLFMIEVKHLDLWAKVRARCLSCARNIAARAAGPEGTHIWRDPNLSTVELIHEPLRSDAEPGLVEKGGDDYVG